MRVLLCLWMLLSLTLTTWADPTQDAIDVVGWSLQIPLTIAQRQIVGQAVAQWSPAQQAAAAAMVAKLEALPKDQRPALRPQALAALNLGPLAEQLKAQADRIIVPGNPPLTGQSLDAFTEWLMFLMDPQHTFSTLSGDANLSASLQSTLATAYPNLTPAEQTALAQLPMNWAALQRTWPTLSAAEQAQREESWRSLLAPLFQTREQLDLAKAALTDLQTALKTEANTPALTQALDRADQIARTLSQSGDAQVKAVADDLATLVANSRSTEQDFNQMLQAANAQMADIAERSKLPAGDIQTLRPVFMRHGQIFVDTTGGSPMRW